MHKSNCGKLSKDIKQYRWLCSSYRMSRAISLYQFALLARGVIKPCRLKPGRKLSPSLKITARGYTAWFRLSSYELIIKASGINSNANGNMDGKLIFQNGFWYRPLHIDTASIMLRVYNILLKYSYLYISFPFFYGILGH
jgi:hypothetical protein